MTGCCYEQARVAPETRCSGRVCQALRGKEVKIEKISLTTIYFYCFYPRNSHARRTRALRERCAGWESTLPCSFTLLGSS